MNSSLCGVSYYPNHTNTRRPQHAPKQTYRRISLRRSVLRYSNPLRNTLMNSSLCGIPFLPKSHKRKRPQHAPEQTYRRISLRRSMLRSFLCTIQLVTPQGYIASQVTIVFNSELCYTWSIKKRAINVSLALGSPRNNKMWWCLTCISTDYTYIYVRHFHCLFKYIFKQVNDTYYYRN